jgi:Na+-translocating ferredoxin:NAD+ oxidoreductase RNF subunit RnfB
VTAYFHSVRLDRDKCKGCTNCIKHCPTEAIRVREGKARITEERCIDCGECIRVCPNHAKVASGDALEDIRRFTYPVALPAPSLYSQFPGRGIDRVLGGLVGLGFAAVFEVALAAEVVSWATGRFLAEYTGLRPLISSACPAVVSLIQVRFPALTEQVSPVEPPVNLAARLARLEAYEQGRSKEEVGVFFLSPCPAKITAARQAQAAGEAVLDGVVPVASVYAELRAAIKRADPLPPRAGRAGVGWGRSGGEGAALGEARVLRVDGIHHVIGVLEAIERGELEGFDFVEAQACPGGCVGGALMVQNPFVAGEALRNLLGQLPPAGLAEAELATLAERGQWRSRHKLEPRPVFRLAPDAETGLVKVRQVEETLATLPGLDCGACGSPTCRALAEDLVQGEAAETDCIFLLREKVRVLAEEVADLARKLPPPLAGPERSNNGE